MRYAIVTNIPLQKNFRGRHLSFNISVSVSILPYVCRYAVVTIK